VSATSIRGDAPIY